MAAGHPAVCASVMEVVEPTLSASPGARPLRAQRAKGLTYQDALRRLANRLVGILHGCLKPRTCYNEATAWKHRTQITSAA